MLFTQPFQEGDGRWKFVVEGEVEEIYNWLLFLEGQGLPLDFELAGTRKVWSRVYMKVEGPIIGFVDDEGDRVYLWGKDGDLRVGEVDETAQRTPSITLFVANENMPKLVPRR